MATENKTRKRTRTKKSTQDSSSRITTNHDDIRKWAEERGGKPATVKSSSGDDVGILRIDFPGYSGEDSLEEISWEDFFTKFDDSNLAFLYQETTSNGEQSRFNKFVSRDKEAGFGEPGKSEMD